MRQKTELRPYQERAVEWFYGRLWGILNAPMGTGKTATALTAIGEMIEDGNIRHGLIIAPKRVAEITWPAEFHEWQHLQGLTWAVCAGSPAQRKNILAKWGERNLTIIGIDNVQWLCEELMKLPQASRFFDLLVIDETSRLRNPQSKRAKALLKVRPRFANVWGLTGTIRPNSELDFYMQATVVSNRQVWDEAFYKWRNRRFYTTDYNGWNWAIKPECKEQLDREFARITLAIDEQDMPTLPPINFVWDEIHLPAPARRQYEAMERELLVRANGRLVEAVNSGVAVGKLTQLAAGYVYAEGGKDDVEHVHDAKQDWLADLIEDLQGEPLLVVYEHIEDLRLIEKAAGYPVPRLGAGVTDAQSRLNIEEWNAGKLPVMAIHPASAGHGLNLQYGGRRMAWISPCWSAEYWDQTIARLYRSGQARHVFVHVAMAVDTIDFAKRMRVFEKLSAQAALQKYLAKA